MKKKPNEERFSRYFRDCVCMRAAEAPTHHYLRAFLIEIWVRERGAP